MRARDIVGRSIVRLHQERLADDEINGGNDGKPLWVLVALELDNGMFLRPVIVELDCGDVLRVELVLDTQMRP